MRCKRNLVNFVLSPLFVRPMVNCYPCKQAKVMRSVSFFTCVRIFFLQVSGPNFLSCKRVKGPKNAYELFNRAVFAEKLVEFSHPETIFSYVLMHYKLHKSKYIVPLERMFGHRMGSDKVCEGCFFIHLDEFGQFSLFWLWSLIQRRAKNLMNYLLLFVLDDAQRKMV